MTSATDMSTTPQNAVAPLSPEVAAALSQPLHDLRSPLGSIKLWFHLMQTAEGDELERAAFRSECAKVIDQSISESEMVIERLVAECRAARAMVKDSA